jgi:hypothetical protein
VFGFKRMIALDGCARTALTAREKIVGAPLEDESAINSLNWLWFMGRLIFLGNGFNQPYHHCWLQPMDRTRIHMDNSLIQSFFNHFSIIQGSFNNHF